MTDIFELQRLLVSGALPSGLERAAQGEIIYNLVAPYADEIYFDTLSNLICRKKGNGKKLIMPAHMDVIGFMATYIDEKGRVRFAPIGGQIFGGIAGVVVRFEKGACGVIVLDDDKKKFSELSYNDFYIDIGAKNAEEAAEYIEIGDTAVFNAPVKLQNGHIITPYADDLSCCIALILAMQKIKESPNDLYFVFTAQEEVGLRGAKTAAFNIQPDMCVALDVCPTGDAPASKDSSAVKLGQGPTVKIKDSSLLCNPQVIEHLRSAAEENGIKYQDEILLAGGTDTASVQRAKGGVLSGCISLPTRNIHTCCECYSVSDLENAAELLTLAACREINV